jgi:hypothetical protein
MKSNKKSLILLIALLIAGLLTPQAKDVLKNGFQKPPASARPWVMYFSMDGNLTKEGITADLEAMARVGLGGLLYFEISYFTPKGPVDFGGPLWMENFKHACKEAQRLGLQINMNNDAGYCGSGGPWITPELSMQKVVWTETQVEGGKPFADLLAQPAAVKNYYKDIAVLAFPTPAAEAVNMADAAPKITSSGTNPKPGQFTLARPEKNAVQQVQLEFNQPFAASALTANLSGPSWAAVNGELQVSDDGQNFKTVQAFAVYAPAMVVSFNPVKSRFFRVVFSRLQDGKATRLEVGNIDLSQRRRIDRIAGKASFEKQTFALPPAEWPVAQPNAVIPRGGILDLTSQMDASGKLTYDFPAGSWTVLRFGHTTTGKENHPSPDAGRGLECDKLSKAAAKVAFDGLMSRLVTANKHLTGQDKVLVATHIDSWEAYSQNWTPLMHEEFKKLRGYDPLKFLPTFTGRVVDSVEGSERFLWDFRQTVSDLIAENYAGEFRRLANEHGLRLSIEAYDGVPADEVTFGGQADEPMGEFWTSFKFRMAGSCTEMASSAHTYGKKIVGAEAFTADGNDKWESHPASMKELGDWAFCEGINRFVFHRYAAQPWINPTRVPGMAYGPYGVHYDRTQPWWEQSKPWNEYLARCQYLLQQGLFVADVAYLQPEGAPRSFSPPAGAEIAPKIRGGYNFDGCTPEVVLERMSVKNGRIVLPDGMSYAVLVLPDVETMTLKLLRKISQLEEQGALIIGGRKPPQKSPSLGDMGAGDAEVKRLADKLWSGGKIITGKTVAEVLTAHGVKPDFSAKPILRYIHRTIGDAEVYFVANGEPKEVMSTAAFRVTGKQPEFWWPESGLTSDATAFEQKDGVTQIPLKLGPSESVFVIFRKHSGGVDPIVSVTRHAQPAAMEVDLARGKIGQSGDYLFKRASGKSWQQNVVLPDEQQISGPWDVAFDSKWGGPAKVTFEKLEDWSKRPEEGIKYYSGTAHYQTVFNYNYTPTSASNKVWLDLGKVAVMAEAKLNGKDLGILWKSPFRVEVTDAIQAGENKLEVKVVNLLVNRQIGDEQLPEDCERKEDGGFTSGTPKVNAWPQWILEGKPSPTGRFTFTNWRLWKKNDPLAESGLIGPVTIQSTEIIK